MEFSKLKYQFRNIIRESCDGVTAIEYALILGLIAIVSMTALKTLGGEIKAKYSGMIDMLRGIETPSATSDTSS